MSDRLGDGEQQSGCSLPGCQDEISVRDAGSGKGYCSKEHLFEHVNGEKTVDDGETTVALESYNCPCCSDDSDRVSYENGEWVHYPCGMTVAEDAAEEADRRLAAGEGVHDHTEKVAKSMAEGFAGDLNRASEAGDGN